MRRATERRLVKSIALSGGSAAGIATRTFTGLLAHMVIRTHVAAPCKAVGPRSRLRHHEPRLIAATVDQCAVSGIKRDGNYKVRQQTGRRIVPNEPLIGAIRCC